MESLYPKSLRNTLRSTTSGFNSFRTTINKATLPHSHGHLPSGSTLWTFFKKPIPGFFSTRVWFIWSEVGLPKWFQCAAGLGPLINSIDTLCLSGTMFYHSSQTFLYIPSTLGYFWKCKWFCRSGMGPEIWHFQQAFSYTGAIHQNFREPYSNWAPSSLLNSLF